MDSRLNEIVRKNGDALAETDGNISALGEVLSSLVNVVSTLQSLKETEANAFFKNLELSFPKDGIDFHKARKLYEINLITQALRKTHGHQANAAKLLRMRVTTLNSIIKKNQISI